MTRTEALELLRTTADELNANYGQELIAFSEETQLLGGGTSLTSSDLVAYIAEVEYRLSEQFGITVVLTDDRAMSQRRSPFRTIGALADYIAALGGDVGV